MLDKLLDAVFGCWHSNYSFPITSKGARRNAAGNRTGTYVVCLDCGKELSYDWKEMRVVEAGRPGRLRKAASLITKEAA